jgi:omega-6 fatty acid desaturase (delta-12 desaturase)
MVYSLNYGYWLTFLLALPTAGFFVRLFIIQHDCGHGAFFSSRAANNTLGFLLGVVTLTPYTYWRKTHAIHKLQQCFNDTPPLQNVTRLTLWRSLRCASLKVWDEGQQKLVGFQR